MHESHNLSDLRARVSRDIAANDPMWGGNMDAYMGVGESAFCIINAAQIIASLPSPKAVLDFGCANGRVTRWLRAAFPQADLHVADIIPEWFESTSRIFEATGWASSSEIVDIVPPRTFDVIWCGSVMTHISKRRSVNLLEKFHQWLSPGGIAVVTSHGQRFVEFALSQRLAYFEDPEAIKPILAELSFEGFGYYPHPGQDQGISATTPSWLLQQCAAMKARVVLFSENAWDDHQDAVVFQKRL